VVIDAPLEGVIVENNTLSISGRSWDDTMVVTVEAAVDDQEFFTCTGTTMWTCEVDVDELSLGDHTLTVRCDDMVDNVAYTMLSFVVNESGHSWGPHIHWVIHTPDEPFNTSNVVLLANVSKANPFTVKTVTVYVDKGGTVSSREMFCYGTCPVQPRHDEDPLCDEPNDPVFGVELGQCVSGEQVTYWVVACDSAQNIVCSQPHFFVVQ
jgi:hypothetical protein